MGRDAELSSETLRVGVLGAGGRMGALICETIEEAPDLELVAAVGRGAESLQALVDAGCAGRRRVHPARTR